MPPRFAQDPALTQCPDFLSESYRLVREAYSAAHTVSDEDAITALVRAWTDGNEAQKQAWVLQQEDNQRIRAEQERLRDQEAAALRQQEEAEAEAERVAIEKKKPKMNGFDPSKSVGDTIIPNPSQYALTKLGSFQWIELWYFSPEACLEAVQQAYSTSDDVFGIAKTEDALGFRQISTARASKNVIQDKDLTWRTFSLAKTNYVRHITKANWPHLHVQSIVDLFFELENHPWRIRLNGERVLLLYLDHVRKEWHTRLALGDGFNIAIINSRLLDEVNDEVWNTSQSDGLMRSVSSLLCLLITR